MINKNKNSKNHKKDNNKTKKAYIRMIVDIIVVLMLISIMYPFNAMSKIKKEDVSYNDFMKYVEQGKVKEIDIMLSSEKFQFLLKEDEGNETNDYVGTQVIYTTQNPKYDDFKKDMLEAGIEVKENNNSYVALSFLTSILPLLIFLGFYMALQKKMMGDNFSPTSFSKKNSASTVTFEDVAGLEEVKQDLLTVVDFLKDPNKYKEAGAKLPKGIMLYGPPGTGKTLLAKAIAGEANVEFISAVGSEFDEKFVGVGAQRIRKLFSDAKKKSPCIIFIDEIDAIGSKRRHGNSSSDRQSINQLLSEMDGFSTDDNVIIIAATNRLEDLDPALIRPGRFDSHFAVPLPTNAADRKAIIDIYTKNKQFDETVNFDLLAKETLGCSPADIESIINEAAIIAVKNNNGIISKNDLDDAFYKQVMKGHKKKDLERKKEEVKLTAYHEAGHALLGVLLGQDVTNVTIIPSTSGAGGVTFFNQEKLGMYSKEELENNIRVLYAGRCAEELLVGKDKITTGASNDIEKASQILKSIVTKYGMSSFGLINLNEIEVDNKEILPVITNMANDLYASAYEMISNNISNLAVLANTLLERESLTGDEVRSILELNN